MNPPKICAALVAMAWGPALLVAADPATVAPSAPNQTGPATSATREPSDHASSSTATSDSGKDAAQKTRNAEIRAKTEPLVSAQLMRRYRMSGPDGGHVTVDLTLGDPSPVEGWTGRWSMRGSATVRNYRAMNPQREDELRRNPKLSIREIERIIADVTFIRSEFVEFDVEVSKLDSTPEIDLTMR